MVVHIFPYLNYIKQYLNYPDILLIILLIILYRETKNSDFVSSL